MVVLGSGLSFEPRLALGFFLGVFWYAVSKMFLVSVHLLIIILQLLIWFRIKLRGCSRVFLAIGRLVAARHLTLVSIALGRSSGPFIIDVWLGKSMLIHVLVVDGRLLSAAFIRFHE